MITIKRLKELIKDLPDDAQCYAYEGEQRGIIIERGDKEWFIEAIGNSRKTEETYTEGFEQFQFVVHDVTGLVPDQLCVTQDQAEKWVRHLTKWVINARPIIEPYNKS